mgnify:CR=1 FL=1|jgi:hypothetical protein
MSGMDYKRNEFKQRDKVISEDYGKGIVVHVSEFGLYPVKVMFNNGELGDYTQEGKDYIHSNRIAIHHEEGKSKIN